MPKKQKPKILNLPSVSLPIKPLTSEELDRDLRKRIGRINKELAGGFDVIKGHPKSVTFFGSARLKPGSQYYQKAVRLGKKISNLGYSIVTGGGPGIMEAANMGGMNGIGRSVGLLIRLPEEQNKNPYVDEYYDFKYFFTRKLCLTFAAEAYLYFPGGYGTLDEFFEIMTLVQTNKIEKVPIILVGKKFWDPINKMIEEVLYKQNSTISKKDMKLYKITDNEEEIVKIIRRAPIRQIS